MAFTYRGHGYVLAITPDDLDAALAACPDESGQLRVLAARALPPAVCDEGLMGAAVAALRVAIGD